MKPKYRIRFKCPRKIKKALKKIDKDLPAYPRTKWERKAWRRYRGAIIIVPLECVPSNFNIENWLRYAKEQGIFLTDSK